MYASKQKLKELNEKEIKLKEDIIELAGNYRLTNKELIRVCAFIINHVK